MPLEFVEIADTPSGGHVSGIPRLAIAVFILDNPARGCGHAPCCPLSVNAHLIFLLVSEAEREAGSGKQTLVSML